MECSHIKENLFIVNKCDKDLVNILNYLGTLLFPSPYHRVKDQAIGTGASSI